MTRLKQAGLILGACAILVSVLGVWLVTPDKGRAADEKKSPLTKAVEVEPTVHIFGTTSQKPFRFGIRDIVSFSGNPGVKARLSALKKLGENLSPEELEALMEFILAREGPRGMTRADLFELKNDILNLLRRQKEMPGGLTDCLLSLYGDKEQHEMIREYAGQHLAGWRERLVLADRGEDIRRVDAALWGGLELYRTEIAGGALRALMSVEEKRAEAGKYAWDDRQRRELEEAALGLAENPHASRANRITALQVCGRLKLEEAVPVALYWGENSRNISLRLSSVGALGEIGGEGVHEFLVKLIEEEKSPLLRKAAERALQKL